MLINILPALLSVWFCHFIFWLAVILIKYITTFSRWWGHVLWWKSCWSAWASESSFNYCVSCSRTDSICSCDIWKHKGDWKHTQCCILSCSSVTNAFYFGSWGAVGVHTNALDLSLQVPGDKILGLAKFFLGIGIPGNAKDFFNQVDSLASLESNK